MTDPVAGQPGMFAWKRSVDDAIPDASRLTTGTVADARLPVSAQATTLRTSYAPSAGLYAPTPLAGRVWRRRLVQALAGERQAHIAVVGDSIAYGAGATNPPYLKAWPGRTRTMLTKTYGDGGTGLVPALPSPHATPALDPRWTFSGTVNDYGMGFYKGSAYQITPGGSLTFTDKCDMFVVYGVAGSSGVNTVQVDGGASSTIRNVGSGGAAVTIEKTAGNHSNLIETHIPAGAYGTHTLTFTAGTSNAYVIGIEGRSASGSFRFSTIAKSGMALNQMLGSGYNDETNAWYGLPLIDMLKADLLIIALGTNDWQGGLSTASFFYPQLTTLVQRQRASGTNTGGGTNAAGDVLLLWNPIPNISGLGKDPALWEAYRQTMYQVANEQNCLLLDLGYRWTDYATANGLGLFFDMIHPDDDGANDLAPAIFRGAINT